MVPSVAFTRPETTSAGTPQFRWCVILPVRTACGAFVDGHLLENYCLVHSQVFG